MKQNRQLAECFIDVVATNNTTARTDLLAVKKCMHYRHRTRPLSSHATLIFDLLDQEVINSACACVQELVFN